MQLICTTLSHAYTGSRAGVRDAKGDRGKEMDEHTCSAGHSPILSQLEAVLQMVQRISAGEAINHLLTVPTR